MALFDVVKYNGEPDVLVWKYPHEELGTWSQLIVNESQEAILFKEGKVLDVYKSGRHKLETANIPLLNNIINLPFGGRSPFVAEVWYINKACSLDVKWGTASPIQLQDPKYKIFVPLRAFGQFGIQIEDSRKFMVALVGTIRCFETQGLVKYFRGLILTKVKDVISSCLIHEQISALEINAYLEEISEKLQNKLEPTLKEYGIKLINFYVNDINVPEDDSAVIQLKQALAKKAEMDIVGYNYTQERSFDTLEGAASNTGGTIGGLMGAGIGLGMGAGVAGNFGSQMGQVVQDTLSINSAKLCPQCGNYEDDKSRFCSICGCSMVATQQKFDSTMIQCSSCGKAFSNSVKFCTECGNIYNPCPNCKADVAEGEAICHKCQSPMPKKCSECGCTQIDPKSKFCPECGTSLVKKCSNCNAVIVGTEKFCGECGQKLF